MAALGVGFSSHLGIQLCLERPPENDQYFHLAIARDYVQQGVFCYDPRITEGALARYRADREPLFHVLLAGALATGAPADAVAKVVPALSAAALALVLLWHSESLLIAALGLFATNTCIFRLSMCRPHVLAVVLVVLGLALLARGRYRSAAIVNLVYTLSYIPACPL